MLRGALIASVALHAALLGWVGFRYADGRRPTEEAPAAPVSLLTAAGYVSVLFGPPTIFTADGRGRTEPNDRILEAERLTELPVSCGTRRARAAFPVSGTVRLSIRASGDADVIRMAESTGSACADDVIRTVASALRYHWLPDERYPAPVQLVQPVTVAEVR